jgi:hypothetical protein
MEINMKRARVTIEQNQPLRDLYAEETAEFEAGKRAKPNGPYVLVTFWSEGDYHDGIKSQSIRKETPPVQKRVPVSVLESTLGITAAHLATFKQKSMELLEGAGESVTVVDGTV